MSKNKRTIVLAAFGTSEPSALPAILNVRERVAAAFPGDEILLAFTSGRIRKIWRARAEDAPFRTAHPEIPDEIYTVPPAPSALAAARKDASRPALLQSLHITDGEEFRNLLPLAPRVGAPALGADGGTEQNLRRAAEALQDICKKANSSNAALVLMAHGNKHLQQDVFQKFESVLRARYGGQIYIGTVEAPPRAGDIAAQIRTTEKILLAPLLLAAGEHARRDMAGDAPESWKSLFQSAGFAVECVLEGLGENDSWADIYVEHLKEILMATNDEEFDRADAYLDAGEGEKALPIFRRLAEETGRLSAMHSIAHTYLYGIAGIPQDYDKAFAWFTRAGEGGCPQGMYHLGMCYGKGYGTPVNPELSFDWYSKSAIRGDEDAMYEVGSCYERGFGVAQNTEKAKKFYRAAAANGQPLAEQRLKEL